MKFWVILSVVLFGRVAISLPRNDPNGDGDYDRANQSRVCEAEPKKPIIVPFNIMVLGFVKKLQKIGEFPAAIYLLRNQDELYCELVNPKDSGILI